MYRLKCLVIALLLAAVVHADGVTLETFVDATGPVGPLKGTMLVPNLVPDLVPGPVALIIPGSGPTDRDGNNPAGINASTYRLLAQDLAARGVTTLRIDKRGMFASAAATPDANAVTIADYVVDVHAWAAVLRKSTGASCIWLVGHSEGGLVSMAAAKDQPDICGLVLVSAAGRPLGKVLRDQLKANPVNAPFLGQAMSAIDALEQGRRVDAADMPPALQRLFGTQVQGFLINAFSYDPRRLLNGYAKPVLVLHGQRDLQVSEKDAHLLTQAAPQATLVLLPDVNHVLKSVKSDDVRANAATYADPALPLAPGVVDSIAHFMISNAKPDSMCAPLHRAAQASLRQLPEPIHPAK
jgi:pimeloyl-ACP methyl ester carboxylesterase